MHASEAYEIHIGALANVLLSALGRSPRDLRIADSCIELLGSKPQSLHFSTMAGPPQGRASHWFGAISIPLRDGSVLRVWGFRRADVTRFVEAARQAWQQFVRQAFDEASEELQMLSQVVGRLEHPRRYPASCLLDPFLQQARALTSRLPMSAAAELLSPEQRRMLEAVARFADTPNQLREKAIETFVDGELAELEAFFDAIESHPLTPEQRRAVVTDEDATLVLAGAGSGKTSVIVAKAAYLVRRGIRDPDEILLLAFGKSAAEEMARRIQQRSGVTIDARTFHALGYEIIRQVEGTAPALSPEAIDDVQFRRLLRHILLDELVSNANSRAHVLRWFSQFHWPHKSEWDFKTERDYQRYLDASDLRTMQGEMVRSFEELKIANWLYTNGIAYEYEPEYERALPGNKRRAYTPDFRLTASGVYIEHFGVRREAGPDGLIRLTTAPHIDREKYLEGMAWKRKTHKAHGTTLVETYSYENVEGCLLEELERKLAPYAKPQPRPPQLIFSKFEESGHVDDFIQTLGTFLRHFKSRELTIEQCRERAKAAPDVPRTLAFLKIFEPFVAAYQGRLADRIDFEDMIRRATDHVTEGRYRSRYRHIVVDEFQDISSGRARLLLALKSQQPDMRIFAVGDDWQSIYRFAGSDIHIMRHFGQVFGGSFADASGIHCTVDLGRTFRSVDQIADAARSFVLKNPAQLKKQVTASSKSAAPAIKVLYYFQKEEDEALQAALRDVLMQEEDAESASVLLLGRYRSVRPANLADLRAGHPSLVVDFKTIHAAKGLEADHVIILRANAGRMGFPSEIVDDALLDMVLPEPEAFAHAEERRLFYVALTRARKTVIILTRKRLSSVFADELIRDGSCGEVKLSGRAGTTSAARS